MTPRDASFPSMLEFVRDVNSKLDSLLVRNIDMENRRVTNAGAARDERDYVRKMELDQELAKLQTQLTSLRKLVTSDSSHSNILVADEAYDATAWNGSLEVPTKNAVRDEMETKADAVTPGGNGAGTYTTITSITINSQGIVTDIQGS